MVGPSDAREAAELPEFTRLIDLAAARLGGYAVYANDEFFAEKENLLQPGRGIFIADKFTDRGKWMDGWETRRRRGPGHDYCVVRLGLPGQVHGFDIDTNHFLGNHPPFASVEGTYASSRLLSEADVAAQEWFEILPKSQLAPGSHNFFAVRSDRPLNHVRLNIYPDGGVARFRVYGLVKPDFSRYQPGEIIDLAAVENGGLVLGCNDMFFGPKDNLIMPGRGVNMGDGWETRRKRVPGFDWVVVKLGAPGKIARLLVDTNHFKGNFPDRCSIEGRYAPNATLSQLEGRDGWEEILPETPLEAHKQHEFTAQLEARGPFTHVRLNIFPDGGVSRFRVFGSLA